MPSTAVRTYFWTVLLLSIPIGILLYTSPALGEGFWPFAIKPLALRMFASVFLAVGVGAALALRQNKWESIEVLVFQGTFMFMLILVAALAAYSSVQLSQAGQFGWLLIFTIIPAAGLLFLWQNRTQTFEASPGSNIRIDSVLKLAFLVHTLVVVFFGMNMLVAPALSQNFWPWKVSETVMQGLGGFFVGSAFGTAWSYRQTRYERVRLQLPSTALFVLLVLLAVGLDWSLITLESPGVHVTILWLSIYLFVAVYSLFFYLRGFRTTVKA